MDPAEQEALGIDADEILSGWKRPVYMVHEHRSRSHHYDLRLEMGGVLRSWAVPKGLPAGPGVRRLAVEVPDHALAYAAFEGTIPAGRAGAGEVAIWDRGTFEVKEAGPDKLVVAIAGRRLEGVYHLVRTAMGGDRRNWLAFRSPSKPGAGQRLRAGRRPTSPGRRRVKAVTRSRSGRKATAAAPTKACPAARERRARRPRGSASRTRD